MSVRVRESTQEGPPRRRGPRWAMVVIVVAVIALAIVFAVKYDFSSDDDSPESGASKEPAAEPAASDKPTAHLALSTETVAFAKTGFPHTEAGAIEAATAAQIALLEAPQHTDSEIDAVAEVLWPNQAGDDIHEIMELGREQQGLADDGSYPDLGPNERYYADFLPQYGAYKVTKNDDDSYDVSIWGPTVFGPGSPNDLNHVQVLWYANKIAVVWKDGQWVMDDGKDVTNERVPGDINRPDVSLRERLDLLGDGWQLYDGASEEWPRDLLGPAPGEVQ